MRSIGAVTALGAVLLFVAGCGGGGGSGGSPAGAGASSSSSSSYVAAAEMTLKTQGAGSPEPCRSTALSNHNILACWKVSGAATSLVQGQIYTSAGTAAGVAFTITAHGNDVQVTPLTNGGFVAMWTVADCTSNCGSPDMIAQVFDASGQAVGQPVVFTPFRYGSEYVALTGLASGKFVIAQTDLTYYGSLQIYNADGTASGAPVKMSSVADFSVSHVRLAPLTGGGFAAAWCSNCGSSASVASVVAQRYDSNGAMIGNPVTVPSQTAPLKAYFTLNNAISPLANGGFAVAYEQTKSTSDNPRQSYVQLQMFNSLGAPVGSLVQVDSDLTHYEADYDMTTLSNGNLAVAWQNGADTLYACGADKINVRVFTADGTPVTAPLTVSTPVTGIYTLFPRLIDSGNVGFGVAWSEVNSQCPILSPGSVTQNTLKARFYSWN